MAAWLDVLLVVGLVGVNALFVAAEYAVVAVRASQVGEMLAAGRAGAGALQSLRDDMPRTIAAVQVCITMTNLVLGAKAEPAVEAAILGLMSLLPAGIQPEGGLPAVVLSPVAFLLVTVVTVVYGELLPKALTLQHATAVAPVLVRVLLPVRGLMRPVIGMMTGLLNLTSRLMGLGRVKVVEPPPSFEELEVLVDSSRDAGRLPVKEGEILQAVFDLPDVPVREVMVPAARVSGLHLGMTRDELRRTALDAPHTRWAVFDKPGGRIIGLATAKHVLVLLDVGDPLLLADLVIPMPDIPETAPLGEAMRRMQSAGRHMGVVVDGHGGQVGIVTLEDVLGRLVGPLPRDVPA